MPSPNPATFPADSPKVDTPPPGTSSPDLPHYSTKIFTPSELLDLPWLPALTEAINAGFSDNGGRLKFAQRLSTDTQLSGELGETGFTAVAFAPASEASDHAVEVIGTVSIKDWVNEGDWEPYRPREGSLPRVGGEGVDGLGVADGERDPCDGDFEIALVTIRPGAHFRKRGIADHLVRVCERELVRRLVVSGDARRSVRLMIKIVKELTGSYWVKKGFTTVGQRTAPKGTWKSFEEFTMWAMTRELAVE